MSGYPAFGDRTLNEIDVPSIQEFLNSKSHLARKTVQEMLDLLKPILQSAVQDAYISTNPAYDNRLTIPTKKKTERKALSKEEMKDIFSHLQELDNRDRLYMALLLFTGMRRGEVLGLKWSDIDIRANEIHVCRNVTYPFGQNDPVIGTPKTEKGARTIPIMQGLREFLSPVGDPDIFVISSEKTPPTNSWNRRALERINKKIDLHGATPHVLRHSFATLLNDAGTDPKTLQSIIGHADIQTTMNRYVHTWEQKKQDAVAQAGRILSI